VIQGKRIDDIGGGKEVHAADVAKAVGILLGAEKGIVAGQSYNCYDMFVTACNVATIAKKITNSNSIITENLRQPKNQIETSKLKMLGMSFGGRKLLEQTIANLVCEL